MPKEGRKFYAGTLRHGLLPLYALVDAILLSPVSGSESRPQYWHLHSVVA